VRAKSGTRTCRGRQLIPRQACSKGNETRTLMPAECAVLRSSRGHVRAYVGTRSTFHRLALRTIERLVADDSAGVPQRVELARVGPTGFNGVLSDSRHVVEMAPAMVPGRGRSIT